MLSVVSVHDFKEDGDSYDGPPMATMTTRSRVIPPNFTGETLWQRLFTSSSASLISQLRAAGASTVQ